MTDGRQFSGKIICKKESRIEGKVGEWKFSVCHTYLSPNRWTFYVPELENLNFCDWKLLRNWDILKFKSLEACKGKMAFIIR